MEDGWLLVLSLMLLEVVWRESGGDGPKRLGLLPRSSTCAPAAGFVDPIPARGWLLSGFEKLVEKRLLIEGVGMLVERPDRFVGGVVPKVAAAADGFFMLAEEGETIGLKKGLFGFGLAMMEEPAKVMGELAMPKDVDMDRWRGIEMDSAGGSAPPMAMFGD